MSGGRRLFQSCFLTSIDRHGDARSPGPGDCGHSACAGNTRDGICMGETADGEGEEQNEPEGKASYKDPSIREPNLRGLWPVQGRYVLAFKAGLATLDNRVWPAAG